MSGWGEAGVDDAPGSIWVVIRELGVVPWQPDRLQSEPRSAFVAQTPELLIHDLDGNLVRDGRWMYYWDAENRLTRVITVAGPSSSFRRVDWKYDARGRRTRQTSYVSSNGVWQVVEDLKFVSDSVLFGRHVADLNATNNAPVRAYVWGLDLSETLDGAGGVGGLLWVRIQTGPVADTHFVCYDGNGNVWNLVSASTGSETARYEYGPFGEPLRLSGPAARFNPFRFSTKRTEDFTGLVLYEYRPYSPTSGRWFSRDQAHETVLRLKRAAAAGFDGWTFLENESLGAIDELGLRTVPIPPRPGWPAPRRPPIPAPRPPNPERREAPEDFPGPSVDEWNRWLLVQLGKDAERLCYKKCGKRSGGCCMISFCWFIAPTTGAFQYYDYFVSCCCRLCWHERKRDHEHGLIMAGCPEKWHRKALIYHTW